MTECSRLFFTFRELARHIWNVGFRPQFELLPWDVNVRYQEIITKLFEGMVIGALNFEVRIVAPYSLGEGHVFYVRRKELSVSILVGELSEGPNFHEYDTRVHLERNSDYRLRFVSFFDASTRGQLDFRFLRVRIERLESNPELVGRLALMEFKEHSVVVYHYDEDLGVGVALPQSLEVG